MTSKKEYDEIHQQSQLIMIGPSGNQKTNNI